MYTDTLGDIGNELTRAGYLAFKLERLYDNYSNFPKQWDEESAEWINAQQDAAVDSLVEMTEAAQNRKYAECWEDQP